MDGARKILKGELLFKEGDKADKVYLIQNGRVSMYLGRGNSKMEVQQYTVSQIAAIHGVFGQLRHPFSAEAMVNTTFIEMPIEVVKSHIENASNVQKVLIKSMSEEIKNALNQIRTFKMKEESSPCPQLTVPRLFGAIYFVAHQFGEEDENGIKVAWSLLRTYAVRVFLEAPARIESALMVLAKLKLVTLHKELNDEEVEELTEVIFHDLDSIHEFTDFYQYNLYKPGRSEIMYFDPFIYPRLKGMVNAAQELEVDRNQAVKIHFDELAESVLKETRAPLKLDHVVFFERKGLFLKRVVEDNQTYIYFNKVEFSTVLRCWQIIRELDLWNERGHVDMTVEPDIPPDEQSTADKCPSCAGDIQEGNKFCPSCGHKLE